MMAQDNPSARERLIEHRRIRDNRSARFQCYRMALALDREQVWAHARRLIAWVEQPTADANPSIRLECLTAAFDQITDTTVERLMVLAEELLLFVTEADKR